jgi:hypothetical protein
MSHQHETYVDSQFAAEIRSLLERRNWRTKSPAEIDDDVRMMLFTGMGLRIEGVMARQPPQPMRQLLSCILVKCCNVAACECECDQDDKRRPAPTSSVV